MVTSKSSQTFADLFAGNRHGGRRGALVGGGELWAAARRVGKVQARLAAARLLLRLTAWRYCPPVLCGGGQ